MFVKGSNMLLLTKTSLMSVEGRNLFSSTDFKYSFLKKSNINTLQEMSTPCPHIEHKLEHCWGTSTFSVPDFNGDLDRHRGFLQLKGPLETICNTPLHTTDGLMLVWAANNLSVWFTQPEIPQNLFPLVFPQSFWPVSGHMWGLASELKS